jgi:hypothetical protein
MSLVLNLAVFEARVSHALEYAATSLAEQMQREFEEDRWRWPRSTKRAGGNVVGSPRNLLDQGQLKASQLPPVVSGDSIRFRWTAPHATRAFLGGITRRGQTLPARNLPLEVTKRGFKLAFVKGW